MSKNKKNKEKNQKKNAWALRVQDRAHLVILPWPAFKQLNTPFRYNKKWYRRSNKRNDWAIAVDTNFNGNRYIKIADTESYDSKSMFASDLIVTFDELLSESERKQKVSEIFLKEKPKTE